MHHLGDWDRFLPSAVQSTGKAVSSIMLLAGRYLCIHKYKAGKQSKYPGEILEGSDLMLPSVSNQSVGENLNVQVY